MKHVGDAGVRGGSLWCRAALAMAIGLCLPVAVASAQSAKSESTVQFDIPSGDLAAALDRFSRQSGIQLLYRQELVAGKRASSATGALTPAAALQKILETSGLVFERADGSTFVLKQAQVAPVPTATRAQAPAAPKEAVPETPTQLQAVMVTGSNLRLHSAAVEGPTPITVITAADLTRVGATSVYEVLRTEPMFAGYADNDTRAGNSGYNGVNLRGLGEEFTLVLLNGRRVATKDLNQVPFVAVERIEVLKDGASAVYGSDAISGVINVILKEDFQGLEVQVGYGNTTQFNDGMRTHASFLSGVKNESGSFLISGQLEKQNAIGNFEHPLGRSDDQRPYGGPDLRANRFNPGLVTFADGSSVMLSPAFAAGQTGSAPGDYGQPYFLPLEKTSVVNVQNDKQVATLYGNGRYAIAGDRAELFLDFLYKNSRISTIDHRSQSLIFNVPASNYWNPFGEAVTVRYLLDYGTAAGRREWPLAGVDSNIDNVLLSAGVRGALEHLDYEFSYTFNKITDVQSHAGLSMSGLEAQLARTDAGALNLFGNAAVTQAQLAPAMMGFERRFDNFVNTVSGVARFNPFTLPAGDVSAAAGVEFRKFGNKITYFNPDSALLLYFNQENYRAERDVAAAYIEANLPLVAPEQGWRFAHMLDLGLAMRYERFSDFGSATVPRATLRWEPFADGALMVRASYSESFQAPPVESLDPTVQLWGVAAPDEDPLILDTNGDPLIYEFQSYSSGSPGMKPTSGKYYNLGFVYSPTWLDGFSVSLDAFALAQRDAIVAPAGTEFVLAGTHPGQIIRSPELTPGDLYVGQPVGRITAVMMQYFNAATRDIKGFDLNFSYKFNAGHAGDFNVVLANTFMTQFEFDQIDGVGRQDGLGNLLFDGIPKYRGKLTVAHDLGPWSTTLSTGYFGALKNSFYDDQVIDGYMTTDLALVYDFDKAGRDAGGLSGSTITFDVSNIFDASPPVHLGLRKRGLISSYSYADYVGRFASVTFRKSF